VNIEVLEEVLGIDEIETGMCAYPEFETTTVV